VSDGPSDAFENGAPAIGKRLLTRIQHLQNHAAHTTVGGFGQGQFNLIHGAQKIRDEHGAGMRDHGAVFGRGVIRLIILGPGLRQPDDLRIAAPGRQGGAGQADTFTTAHQKDGDKSEGGGPRITPSKRIVLLDDDHNVLPLGTGETGWIAKRGKLPQGYYKDEEKTRRSFVVASDGKRYGIPGDLGISHPDGTMTLLGRGSTSINSGGEKIFPEEVEGAVKSHPAVLDCLVVGTPDERWGQSVTALVQCRPGELEPGLDDIHGACADHIARYKLPRRIFYLDELKRTPSGKPDYSWAKKRAQELIKNREPAA